MKSIVTSIRIERDTDVAHARRTARLTAKVAGAPARDQIRFATAVSEIARNALQYADGGIAEFSFDRPSKVLRLTARLQDKGAGIPKIETILRGRHQSHTGLGLGISGSQKLVDDFDLTTGTGGTLVTLRLHLGRADDPSVIAKSAAAMLVSEAQGSPLEELAEQNRALRDSLAEQEFLLRELHHRTKNNLAIIQSLALMQARRAKTREAKDALETLTNRIQAFANAHNLLHRAEDVAHVDLQQHMVSLVERLASAFGSPDLQIVCDAEAIQIDFEVATEIGLVVNELVTNAAKHAFQSGGGRGRIDIRAALGDPNLQLTVKDNGPGLKDPETVLRNSKSLGWNIVEGSARKLNAEIEIDGSEGLSVTLKIPQI